MFGGDATLGGVLAGYGSTADVTLENKTNGAVLEIPTGSVNVNIVSGGLQIGGNNAISFPAETTTGASIAIGYQALREQPLLTAENYRNIAIGYDALSSVSLGTTAVSNTAVGYFALLSDTAGSGNAAYGYGALDGNTTGINNTATGYLVLGNNTSGNYSTGIGFETLLYSTGSNNTALGTEAGQGVNGSSTFTNDVLLGYKAGYTLTTGSSNIIIDSSGSTTSGITTGSSNISIGNGLTLLTATSSNQLDIGNLIFAAGLSSGSTLSTGTVGIGTATMSSSNFLEVNGAASIGYPDTYGGSAGGLIVSGNVGIGTASPSYPVHAYAATGPADITMQVGSGNAGINLIAGSKSWAGYVNSTADAFQWWSGTASNTMASIFNNGGMSIGTSYAGTTAPANGLIVSGNVGIGTTSPLSKLSVAGNLAIGSYGGGASTTAAPSNGLIVSGNVGIGTTNPTHLLEVLTNYAFSSFNVQTMSGAAPFTGSTTGVGIGFDYNGVTSAGIYLNNSDVFTLQYGSSVSMQMTNSGIFFPGSGVWNNSGNVGLGTTTLTGSNVQLAVNGGMTVGTYADTNANPPANGIIVSGQTGVGTTAPNAAALLDVYSTSKGLLPPRVTAAQEIAIGTNVSSGGLLVYNTSLNELDVYNSSTQQWEAVGANAADAAGSDTQIQFNQSGDLGADSNFNWDYTNHRLGIGTSTMASSFEVNGNESIGYVDTAAPSNGLLVKGNVGIGTASPSYALDLIHSAGSSTFRLGSNTTDYMYMDAGGVESHLYSAAALPFKLGANGNTAQLVLASSGNVGIGTASPASLLHVSAGYSGLTPLLGTSLTLERTSQNFISLLTGSVGAAGMYFGTSSNISGGIAYNADATNALALRTGSNNTRLLIDQNGNVGIGTTSPSTLLHVRGGASGQTIPTFGSGGGLLVETSNSGGNQAFQVITAGGYGLAVQNNGVVGIGTTTPSSASALHVWGGASGQSTSNLASGAVLIESSSQNSANAVLRTQTVSGYGLSVMGNGIVGIGTTSPQSKLHIQAGEVQVGSSGASCAAANAGAIRYSAGTLYFCDNTPTWEAI